MSMYDLPGAIYINHHKKYNEAYTGERVPYRIDSSWSSNSFGWGCSGSVYLVNYQSGYLNGAFVDNISQKSVSGGTGTYSWTSASDAAPGQTSGIALTYGHVTLGFRGFTSYPGYNSRIGYLTMKPHYVRMIATSGFA